MDETNKIWLKTVTPERLAKIKVGDWLEGYGDVMSVAEERLIQKFGQLFCNRLEAADKKIEQQQSCIRELIKTLQIENQCVKCRYGDKSEERCTDDADGELPCIGFDEAFDGSVFLEQAIAKAKELIE